MFRFFIWRLFLPSDWYLVATSDGMIIAAHWNGIFFETRLRRLEDAKVRRICSRIPQQEEIRL